MLIIVIITVIVIILPAIIAICNIHKKPYRTSLNILMSTTYYISFAVDTTVEPNVSEPEISVD